MKRLIILLIMLLLVLPSWAENWQQMGKGPALEIYLDMDSLSKQDDLVSTSQKFVYTAEDKKGSYSLLKVTLKKDKTFRLDKIETFDAEGNLTESGESDKYNEIAPGSPIETIYKVVFAEGE